VFKLPPWGPGTKYTSHRKPSLSLVMTRPATYNVKRKGKGKKFKTTPTKVNGGCCHLDEGTKHLVRVTSATGFVDPKKDAAAPEGAYKIRHRNI